MRTSRLTGKEVQKVHSGFYTFDLQVIKLEELLPPAATRNARFSSLTEDAYSTTPGLQSRRRSRALGRPAD